MSLLECINLVKQYPGKLAVAGVDFHVEPGEIVGLLGPNGAGKTTSFRMTCGLVAPTRGKVIFNGQDVSNWPLYKRAQAGMGYLPQDTSIFAKLTVEQNLFAVLEYQPISAKDRQRRCDELLDNFGLMEKRKQVSQTMSGGEKRRLEIARCLASKPRLILLDEPFTGIDPVTIHHIQDIIADLRRQGISILLTDHRERETLTITDRSYVVFAGRILVSGNAEKVLRDEQAQQFYFGKRFDAESIIASQGTFQSKYHERSTDLQAARQGATAPIVTTPAPAAPSAEAAPVVAPPTAQPAATGSATLPASFRPGVYTPPAAPQSNDTTLTDGYAAGSAVAAEPIGDHQPHPSADGSARSYRSPAPTSRRHAA